MSAYTFFFVHTVKNHNPAKLSDLVGHLGTHIRNDESLICPHENCNTANTPIGHTNVYSSYGWLIPARVMVLYVPNGYGSCLCLVYATSHLLFGGFCSYLV